MRVDMGIKPLFFLFLEGTNNENSSIATANLDLYALIKATEIHGLCISQPSLSLSPKLLFVIL